MSRGQLGLEDQVQVLELENKALRFQTEKQSEIITGLQDELHFYKRFRMLVERAATIMANLPDTKEEILSRKKT